jgi:hypothetical protein
MGLVLDATSVYWIANDAVMKAPLGGGTIVTLASDPTGEPYGMALDAKNVYWVDGNTASGRVLSVPIGGGAVHTIAENQVDLYGVAVDATSIYWTTEESSGS